MNMTINQLPSRTWNRLNMNEARVDLEGAFENLDFEVLALPDGAVAGHENWKLSGDLSGLTRDAASFSLETQAVMDSPAVVRCHLDRDCQKAGNLCLSAGDNGRLKAVVVLTGDGEGTMALQIQVKAGKNARVELYLAQLLDRKGRCLNHIAASCGEGAEFSLTRLELGARTLCSGVQVDLRGRESQFAANIGYHALEGQNMDMNYVCTHYGQKTNCQMDINGTLEEGSRKNFKGTIDFRRGCAGAKGKENENVLLMGETMVNQTLPVILCQEEDVEGNHGASIGQLDEKVLFYLGTRGISQEDAKKLIAQARIQAVCDQIPSQKVRDMVLAFEENEETDHGEL